VITASKVVGVLGGMGPEATVDFMAKVIALTPAEKDQDHIHMLVDHNPTVPNRQTALLNGGEDPGPVLATMAKRLEAAGADFLVIPCNTAFAFASDVREAVDIPLISIIDVTIDAILQRDSTVRKVGVLATNGCLQAGVYQDALQRKSLTPVLPDANELAELMQLVNGIKAGDKSETVAVAMHKLADALLARGAEAIVAGCTEIPLVLEPSEFSVMLVSSTEALAAETVRRARD
jgi:aspartate racemase